MSGLEYSTGIDNASQTLSTTTILFVAIISLLSIILGLLYIVSLWKIFKKAGKPGWAALVPIYNIIIMLEIADLPLWYILLFIIPFVAPIILIVVMIKIAKNFGKTTLFGIGMSLLGIIFIPSLAFSDSLYKNTSSNANETNQDGFDAMNVINNNDQQNNIDVVNASGIPTIENANIMVEGTTSNIENSTETEQLQTINEEPSTLEGGMSSMDTTNNESGLEPEPQVLEQTSDQPVEIDNTNTESIEQPIEPQAFNQIPDQSIVNNNTTELNVNNSVEKIDTLDQNQSIENNQSVVETSNESNESDINVADMQTNEISTENPNETPNAFNSVPLETDSTNNIQPELNKDVKICKSCGKEMPKIVSICPNCGTENE